MHPLFNNGLLSRGGVVGWWWGMGKKDSDGRVKCIKDPKLG